MKDPMIVQPLSFEIVSAINKRRSDVRHGKTKWSLLEWAGALCGEAGELANVAKKIRRIEQGMTNPKGVVSNLGTDRETVIRTKLASEIGDTYLYLDLLATEAGLRIEDCVRLSFNAKSEELGLPNRIP